MNKVDEENKRHEEARRRIDEAKIREDKEKQAREAAERLERDRQGREKYQQEYDELAKQRRDR